MNVVMTSEGKFVEVQGTGEHATFGDKDLATLLAYAKAGIAELFKAQRKAKASFRFRPFAAHFGRKL